LRLVSSSFVSSCLVSLPWPLRLRLLASSRLGSARLARLALAVAVARLVSSRLVSARLASPRLASPRLASSRLVSSRLPSSRLVRLVSSRLVSCVVSSRLVRRLVSSRLVWAGSFVPQKAYLPSVWVCACGPVLVFVYLSSLSLSPSALLRLPHVLRIPVLRIPGRSAFVRVI
jgi:hypothetical protein